MKNKNKELMDMEDDIYSRHPKPHNLPLWKILNEQRTHGEWKLPEQENSMNEYTVITDDMTIANIPAIDIDDDEGFANARYAALAVNNLHILAEALEAVIRVADRKTEEFDKAKQALNNIS